MNMEYAVLADGSDPIGGLYSVTCKLCDNLLRLCFFVSAAENLQAARVMLIMLLKMAVQ